VLWLLFAELFDQLLDPLISLPPTDKKSIFGIDNDQVLNAN